MQTYTHDRRPCYYFDTVEEFLAYVSPDTLRARTGPHAMQSRLAANDTKNDSWAGGLSYSRAYQMARTGAYMSTALLELRDKLVSHIKPAVEQNAYWDVSGGSTIDMGAYLAGQPECILNYRDESAKSRKTISLVYNACVSGGVDVNILRLRGMAFLALVDAIEMSRRYKTNVYYVAANDGGDSMGRNALIIKAKTTESHYDPQSLGFALGHPGMFRKLTFGFWTTIGGHWNGTMGSVHTLRTLPVELGESEAFASEGGMLGDYVNTDAIYNERTAVMWVLDQLQEYGIDCLGVKDHTV